MTASGFGHRDQLEALSQIADRQDLDTLLLREPANLAWLLGCRFHVPNTLDVACFDVVVSDLRSGHPSVRVVSNAIEAPRLRDTELGADTAPPVAEQLVVPWWQDRTALLPSGAGVGADRPWSGAVSVAAELAAARRVLTGPQVDLLADVSRDAASAVTRVAHRLRPAMSEYEVAGLLSAELLAVQLEPVVLMVAADGRDRMHRHPLPTARVGERSFLLVCCGRRFGLIASVTRTVVFADRVSDLQERLDRYAALLAVEQVLLDKSVPGARLGDVVQAGIDAYGEHGFAGDEWTRHHQGGITGWMPREFPAYVDSDVTVEAGMALAWNPSGDGCKVEDTCIVTDAGAQPLVFDPEWPQTEAGGRSRPGILAL